MNTLFPFEPDLPKGFRYFPDFITQNEERQLVEIISSIEVKPMLFQGYEAKRKVASFGYDWSFERRVLSKGKPIPGAFTPLIHKVASKINIAVESIAELLITEYPQGSVINWHRDAPPFDTVIGISLLSDCLFRFRPHDKNKQGRKNIQSLNVERRSLYVMKGEARSEWEHSITPVRETRFSITLRTLAGG